jgi:hypothetical protein
MPRISDDGSPKKEDIKIHTHLLTHTSLLATQTPIYQYILCLSPNHLRLLYLQLLRLDLRARMLLLLPLLLRRVAGAREQPEVVHHRPEQLPKRPVGPASFWWICVSMMCVG